MEELTQYIKKTLGHPIRPTNLSVGMVETFMEIAKEDLEDLLQESNVTLHKNAYDIWVRDYTIELSREGAGRAMGMYKSDDGIDYETLINESKKNLDILRKKII